MTMKTMIADGDGSKRQTVARSVSLVVLATALILLVPWVAMQFTTEVAWKPSDFLLAGVLLTGTGLGFVIAMRKLDTSRSRAAAGIALALALVLVWIELAVGIFGTPFAGS
jgi:RsiW-degrading membrane proteinase PrsW (M82 family)